MSREATGEVSVTTLADGTHAIQRGGRMSHQRVAGITREAAESDAMPEGAH